MLHRIVLEKPFSSIQHTVGGGHQIRCPWCGMENAVGAETCGDCGVILTPRAGTRDRPVDPEPLAINNQSGVPSANYSPEGTWSTTSPVTFNVMSNWPGSGELEYVGYETRDVSLVITGTSDPGTVLVEVMFGVGSVKVRNGSMYARDISPDHFTGTVSATFWSDGAAMTGTWNRLLFFGSYSQEIYTDSDAITLYRQ